MPARPAASIGVVHLNTHNRYAGIDNQTVCFR
jgi:hypothetical protein